MNTCQSVDSAAVTNAAVIFTASGALVFVLAYAWTTRGAWRASMVGVNVMAFMTAITVVSALAVAAIIWGTDWPYRTLIRTTAWGLIGVCIWWRVILLLQVQHERDVEAADPAMTDPEG